MIKYSEYASRRFKQLTPEQQEKIMTNAEAHMEFEASTKRYYEDEFTSVHTTMRPPGVASVYLLNRVGVLKISEELYSEFWRNIPKGMVIPLEITFSYRQNCFIVWAYSDLFDDISESDKVIEYYAQFLRTPEGTVEFVRFAKVDL